MSTLTVPVSINGDTKDPSGLEERELFLNTSTRYLFAGFDAKNTTGKIKVGFSDEAGKITKNWLNIDTSSNTPVFKVGDMTYDGSKFTSATTYTMDKLSVTDLTKLVLKQNSGIYGTDLPSTGVEGQVFFNIG